MRGSYSRLLSIAFARLSSLRDKNTWSFHGRLRSEILFTRDLGRGTGDPLWLLIQRLRNPSKTLHLSEALFRNGVPFEEIESWRKVMEASDIDEALSLIEQKRPLLIHTFVTTPSLADDYVEEVNSHGDDNLFQSYKLPTWLVVYIASYQVRTPAQANNALLNLVFNQLPLVHPKIQPSLLVLVTLSLAKFSLLAPIRRVLNIFLTIPVDHPTVHFNLLLQAIARLPKSAGAADLAVTVLEAMTSRGILLSTRTYHILLADRFVTLQLTKLLQAKMVQQKFTPSAAHLESFVRVFSRYGAIHDAGRYLEAIRLYGAQSNKVVPYVQNLESTPGTPHPANTKFIRAFRDDRVSAFDYLSKLLDHSQQPEPNKFTIGLISSRPRRPTKRTVDVFDWTMTFAVATRDRKTSAEQLIRLFNQTATIGKFRPTVATYTALIRGLLWRKKYMEAVHAWDRLIADRLTLDRKALGAGVKALTLAGEPLRAFDVLETFAARPQVTGTRPASNARVRQAPTWKRPRRTERCPEQRPVQLDTMVLNDFMIALLRINRPDVVFRLWDHMEKLYNVKPDDCTLDTLCRSARLASKMDKQTLAGNMAMMGLSNINPFRKTEVEMCGREDVVRMLGELLVQRKSGGIVMGLWKGVPAFEGVQKVFRQIILGNWPEMRNVKSPAHAVRLPDAYDGPLAPLTEVAQSIAQCLSPLPSPSIPARPTPSPASPSIIPINPSYTSIIPSERTFFAYILLLGTSSHQHIIPLTLAWMHNLPQHTRTPLHPRRSTLAIALIFWAEVSLRGPLFEAWMRERAGGSEYEKLVRWLEGWVGEKGVPQDGEIMYYLGVVRRARDWNAPGMRNLRGQNRRMRGRLDDI